MSTSVNGTTYRVRKVENNNEFFGVPAGSFVISVTEADGYTSILRDQYAAVRYFKTTNSARKRISREIKFENGDVAALHN